MAENRAQHAGRMVVIHGCMFAGKTARLIDRLLAAQASGVDVRAFKHRLDVRYDPYRLITHDGRSFPSTPVEDVRELVARIRPSLTGRGQGEGEGAEGPRRSPMEAGTANTSPPVIAIDEAQFFGRALVPVCRQLVAAGGVVIVAGIDHDAWGQDFPPLPELRDVADETELLTVPCTRCSAPARFSQRMVPVVGGQMVGGPREYEPRCAAHFTPLPPPLPVYT